jgi:hypothetical protein
MILIPEMKGILMTSSRNRIIFWIPRILCILFAIFISLFSLDVFSEGCGFWKTIAALSIHMIPTASILVILLITWQRSWLAALLLIILGVWYLVWTWGRFNWTAYAFISGPLFLTGLLYLADWLSARRLGQNV